MCGVTGFVGWKGSLDSALSTLNKMKNSLVHRGPDGNDIWKSNSANAFLAHTRLSILDLSKKGSQPMKSKCGRYILSYNGEIYNPLEIRNLLKRKKDSSWQSSTDSETLLESFSFFGVIKTLQLARGMFAIALFDVKKRKLYLTRDRFGEKPLYYLDKKNGCIAFGSELTAFNKFPGFSDDLDTESVSNYFLRGYIGAPRTVWRNVKKVMPGTILTFQNIGNNYILQGEKTYWSIENVALHGQNNIFSGSYEDAKTKLDNILSEIIAAQLVSDVPLGVFLSGGIDSSLIAAFSQKINSSNIKTFSVGFQEKSYDESKYAEEIASYLGTDHETLFASSKDALSIIEDLPKIYSEPFADSSQLPTVVLCRMVKKHVTVALSGDGGDELFGGYVRYSFGSRNFGIIQKFPFLIRSFMSSTIKNISPGIFETFGNFVRWSDLPRKIYKLSDILECRSFESYYDLLTTYWPNGLLVDEKVKFKTVFKESLGPIENMMLTDQLQYLPNDILVKVDRAAMSESLETRSPLLDHQLAEFSWTLPNHWRFKNGQGKRILKEVLYQYLPKKLLERPKQGFGVPISAWLRGPLKDWANNLCSPTNLPNDGLINGAIVRKALDEHLSGKRNWDYRLWPILMWQQWQFSR